MLFLSHQGEVQVSPQYPSSLAFLPFIKHSAIVEGIVRGHVELPQGRTVAAAFMRYFGVVGGGAAGEELLARGVDAGHGLGGGQLHAGRRSVLASLGAARHQSLQVILLSGGVVCGVREAEVDDRQLGHVGDAS